MKQKVNQPDKQDGSAGGSACYGGRRDETGLLRLTWKVHTRAVACVSPTALILKTVAILLKISASQSSSS